MKILSIVGARPQFVKLGPVSRALRARGIEEFVLHTGQHYDFAMSESFFRELSLPAPDANLGIAAASPAAQVGAMVPAIARVVARVSPSMTLVFGDTSSTLAGALASAFGHVPVAHVEAGMRSFNRAMPEELNRVLVDHLADLLFTASRAAGENLRAEGLPAGTFVGDVMYDVVKEVAGSATSGDDVLQRYGVRRGEYVLATVHRASNTDDAGALEAVLRILAGLGVPVLFPVHRVRAKPSTAPGWGGRGWAGAWCDRSNRPGTSRRWRWQPAPGGCSPTRGACRRRPSTSACRARRFAARPSGSRRSNWGGTS